MEQWVGYILFFAVNALFLVWVYRDVRSRDGAYPTFWAGFVFVTGIVGLVLYMLLRPATPLAIPREQ